MSDDSSAVKRLLLEIGRDAVTPLRYNRRSIYGRLEPLLATAALVIVAMSASVFLAELRSLRTTPLVRRRLVRRD